MAVRRWRLWRLLDSRDDVGSVDTLGLLRIFFAVKLEQDPVVHLISHLSAQNHRNGILFGAIGVDLQGAAQ